MIYVQVDQDKIEIHGCYILMESVGGHGLYLINNKKGDGQKSLKIGYPSNWYHIIISGSVMYLSYGKSI